VALLLKQDNLEVAFIGLEKRVEEAYLEVDIDSFHIRLAN